MARRERTEATVLVRGAAVGAGQVQMPEMLHGKRCDRFALFFRRSPDRVDLAEIEQYLFFLRDVKKVSYSLFDQTVCALRFFYLYVMDRPDWAVRIPHGRREKHYPVVLAAGETLAILAALQSLRDRVILTVLYSAGLRLGEVCRLAVADVDSARMLLHIRQGKGHKDRSHGGVRQPVGLLVFLFRNSCSDFPLS